MIVYKSIDKDIDWLRQVSKEVDFSLDSLEQDIALLKDFCREEDVLAMAAVQLGIAKRLVYLKKTDLNKLYDEDWNEDMVLINPVITKRTGLAWYWESCQSCLDKMGLVLRPYSITISYYDINGKKRKQIFKSFSAVVLSHELDHLDGVLHIDKSLQIYDMVAEGRKKFRETHPYHVFYKRGEFSLLEEQYLKDNKEKNINKSLARYLLFL